MSVPTMIMRNGGARRGARQAKKLWVDRIIEAMDLESRQMIAVGISGAADAAEEE